MDLNTELSKISGIGTKFLVKLNKFKIKSVKDLLWHFPFRYDDFSKIAPIGELSINQPATIHGVIKKISIRRSWKKRMAIIEAFIVDESGGIKAVWFNQPYLMQILKVGTRANFAGKIAQSQKEIYLSNPAYEITDSLSMASALSGPKHTAGLIPVYPETKGLTSKGIRYLIKPILKNLSPTEDFMPPEILKKNNLPEINLAIKKIHFPLALTEADTARKRFAFEDLFLLQLNNLKIKSRLAQEKGLAIHINMEYLKTLVESLPFALTDSQRQSLKEIILDIQKPRPMNRLLQGDVGSGKTVIAALAAVLAAKDGKQTAFLAPTEVLAQQHYRTLTTIFKDFAGQVCLLTASSPNKKKLLSKIGFGEMKIIIGTHAIIQKNVKFDELALVIVDEQHRFGVEQRATLLRPADKKYSDKKFVEEAKKYIPHLLSMSATPIPRTLSLTIFGDLDLSTITELPANNKAYGFIKEQIKKGRQAFVICPRIEPGQKEEGQILTEIQKRLLDLKSVKEEFEKLSKKVFPDLKLVMLHGKMKGKEKDIIMKDFADKKIDILVSTSVIEVGVNIPNATIMMIEGADRFGLAQLYQFRGRVGRGEHQSFCLLFTDSTSGTTQQRLNSLLTAKNGFELAEKDLAIRGPGQFLGENQTGLPDIAMRALQNIELVKDARSAAEEIFSGNPELSAYPALAARFKNFEKQVHLE
ncbi:MAG: ATP-dependent DNA helicase RecG [Parcubacteria group bacterium Athens0714_26]|nr:MAG: ATP-dependent DNA helicase RecG [Parcubacteria group bacterium Athens0714_26]